MQSHYLLPWAVVLNRFIVIAPVKKNDSAWKFSRRHSLSDPISKVSLFKSKSGLYLTHRQELEIGAPGMIGVRKG